MHQESQSEEVESKVEALAEILPRLLAIYGLDQKITDADTEKGVETERGPLVGAPA